MSASTTPPHDAAGRAGDPDPSRAPGPTGDAGRAGEHGASRDPGATPPAIPPRRGATRVRPDADFELMLALRGAARARDLRNRIVRPRLPDTRDLAAGRSSTSTGDAAAPRDLAQPDQRSG
jgi:hypothetical protein